MKKTVFTLIFLFSIFTGFSQTNEDINNFKENNNNLLNELNVENDQLNDIIALTLKYNERKQSLESNGADSKFIQKNMKGFEIRLKSILNNEQFRKYNGLKDKFEFN